MSQLKPQLAILLSILVNSALTTFSDDQKKTFLVIHNKLRLTAAPTATAMRFVTWSPRLEELAVKAAADCSGDHAGGPDFKSVGENIYFGGSTDPVRIITGFISEKNLFDHAKQTCMGSSKCSCGHYTQVMSHQNAEIGCATNQKCSTKEVRCIYSVLQGTSDYGPPCSKCPAEAPLCWNGLLCISAAAASSEEAKMLDPKATATPVTVDSHNCLPCLNGGAKDATDPSKCKCQCVKDFLGERCEIAKGVYENSVRLAISAAGEFRFANKYAFMPPVSKSLFNTLLWSALQAELAPAVNEFCRSDASNFAKCCPGSSFPGATAAAAAILVKPDDFKFIESTLGNLCDGSLNFNVYAVVSDGTLCSASKPTYIAARSVLLPAVQAKMTAISSQLTSCCESTVLKSITESDLASLTNSTGYRHLLCPATVKDCDSSTSPNGASCSCDHTTTPTSAAALNQAISPAMYLLVAAISAFIFNSVAVVA